MRSTVMLCKFEGTRENNYTLLRLLFALAVLVGHAYPITGNGSDPLSARLLPATWVGGVAVSGFFVISGYLVTASFQKRGAFYFIASRVLRLYPAIIMYSVLMIILIGPLFANVPIRTYFDANPWLNLWNALLWDWKYNLPHVF